MSYEAVNERVSAAAAAAGLQPGEITLVAVSKTMTPDQILSVYEQGHRDFGENRAQELVRKAPQLPDDIRWHFVGALQSRKAKTVRPHTHLLHSMDRVSLAAAWTKGELAPPPALLQVNIGQEDQKSGVAPDDVREALAELTTIGVDIRGLMAIPPIPETPEDSRPFFAALRALRDDVASEYPGVMELSMGMTDDFEVAISEGASIIRVGRAIFGPRN